MVLARTVLACRDEVLGREGLRLEELLQVELEELAELVVRLRPLELLLGPASGLLPGYANEHLAVVGGEAVHRLLHFVAPQELVRGIEDRFRARVHRRRSCALLVQRSSSGSSVAALCSGGPAASPAVLTEE